MHPISPNPKHPTMLTSTYRKLDKELQTAFRTLERYLDGTYMRNEYDNRDIVKLDGTVSEIRTACAQLRDILTKICNNALRLNRQRD